MSYRWGTDIVRNGLIFCVDPANVKSFDSGSAPNDVLNIIDTTITGSLKNGMSYSSDKYGVLNGDGVDNHIEVAHRPEFTFGTGNFTMEFWTKYELSGNFRWIISKHNTGDNNGFRCGTWNDRKWVYRDRNSGVNIFGTTAAADETWYHIVWTREGTGANQLKFYENGILDAQGTSTGNFSTTDDLFICSANWNVFATDPWLGDIGIVRLYNRALSASEIKANYDNTKHRYQ